MSDSSLFYLPGALRFMRKIIGLKEEFYYRHIINSNLFAPVVDAFVRNNGRYNLLDSAIIEMFEFIKMVSHLEGGCVVARSNRGLSFIIGFPLS